MVKKQLLVTSVTIGIPLLVLGCGSQPDGGGETTNNQAATPSGSGTITLVANGEDFVRQGFIARDGWRIDFDHVYVTLGEVKAYQSDPPFNPTEDQEIQAKTEVTLVSTPTTIDLAEGGEQADPITVTEDQGSAGFYNALAWEVVSPDQGDVPGAIVLQGTAQKDGESIDFTLNLDQPLAYRCGEFIGDVRKGFLEADSKTQLETTFHFDHIFGDADAPMDDAINTGAVGFGPFAQLASNGTVNVDLATLQQEFSPENYQTLEKAIQGLGHVGEGHCEKMET